MKQIFLINFFYMFSRQSGIWNYFSGIYVSASVNVFTSIALGSSADFGFGIIFIGLSLLVISLLFYYCAILLEPVYELHKQNLKIKTDGDNIKQRWYDALQSNKIAKKMAYIIALIIVLNVAIVIIAFSVRNV